ncbi:cytochrome P450 [Phycomyces nitens]|nr:cytochrome P450 [Phycomyces nitens]
MDAFKDNTLATAGVICLGIVASFVYNLYSTKCQKQKEDYLLRSGFKQIPSPLERYPYIGHIMSLGKSPTEKVKEWHEQLGPVIRLNMGVQEWILVNDPDIAHQIFVRHGVKTSERQRHRYAHDVYGKGGKGIVFNQAGAKWKATRKMALAILSPTYTEQFEEGIVDIATETIRGLLEDTKNEGSVSPEEYMRMATYTAMYKSIFGDSKVPSHDSVKEIVEMTNKAMVLIGPAADIGSFLPAFSWVSSLLLPTKVMEEVIVWRDAFFKKHTAQAIAGDYNSLVKQAYSLMEDTGLDDGDITVMISDLMGAGGDTTSIALSWFWAIISQRQDVQKSMSKEIDDFVAKHNRVPRYADRTEMPYTLAVLRENLRFRSPTVFGIPHYTPTDLEVCGYFIPAGTVLISSMYAMHMNPNVYDEPEKFKPERFLGDSRTWAASVSGGIESRDMYSFGWGRRICPGIHFAEVEMFNICVNIIARCSVEPALDVNGKPVYVDMGAFKDKGVVCCPKEYTVRFIEKPNNL